MKQKNSTIAIVGRFNFPTGDAASTRVIGVGKILKSLGYNVVFIGKCMRPEDPSCLSGSFDGFKYYNIPNRQSPLNRMRQIIFSGEMTVAKLEQENVNPSIIIYYGNSSTYLKPLLKYAKRKKIKLVTDIVEWYDPGQVNGGKLSPMLWDVNHTIQKVIPKCDGVIAISSFFQKYYDKKGMTTIRVPQLFDIEDSKWKTEEATSFCENSLNLVYAGVPGKKDSIDIIIKSVKKIVDQGHSIKLHLFGPSPEQIEDVLEKDKVLVKDLEGTIVFHGRINHHEIPINLAKADFSVLIRPDMRYANAGFPTKFVESLAAGVPVIANLTSDIGLYLKEGHTGFVVKDNSVENLAESILKAIKIAKNEKLQMKKDSKNEARRSFYYKNHVEGFENFLLSLNKN
ncbi:glycosyltransferase [Maribacter sp. 2308TA10-17]|uniref:glycosyltransferase n=1 Tax=Maribacter sp. 2308TA10-17 TaxID=3386276 RepID=UPI0039BCEB46